MCFGSGSEVVTMTRDRDKVMFSHPSRPLGYVPTPKEIVQRMVELAAPRANPSAVLEPACGDGRFLRCFGETFGFHHKLIGVEINPCHPLFIITRQCNTSRFSALGTEREV
jgi:hypothetical protein